MSTVALYEGKAALYKAHPSCTTGHLTRFLIGRFEGLDF